MQGMQKDISTAAKCSEDTDKRQLIDSLEAMRTPRTRRDVSHAQTECLPPVPATQDENSNDEVLRLRRELKLSQATNALLEKELHSLEQKALSAIAEAGLLRRQLDQQQAYLRDLPDDVESLLETNDDLARCLNFSTEEKSMLVQALTASESEIARLTGSVQLLSRKFNTLE